MFKQYLNLTRFLIVLAVLKYSESFLTDIIQNIIESLNQELNIKHLTILKSSDFEVRRKTLIFIKDMSDRKVYASAVSVPQMTDELYGYYYTSKTDYDKAIQTGETNIIDKKYSNRVYPPKTMVLLFGKNVVKTINDLFKNIKASLVTKYIWLIADDLNGSYFEPENYYIPYNSQFLRIRNYIDKKNSYLIEEFYRTSFRSPFCAFNIFGIWEINKGLKIFEPDFYARRLDMNGTILNAYLHEGLESEFSACIKLTLVQCQLLNEITHVLKLRLEVTINYQKEGYTPYEILIEGALLNYRRFSPYYVGPIARTGLHLYIAYDKNFEHHGISPFLSPFSFELWMALLAWITVTTILTTIIYYFYNKTLRCTDFSWNHLFEPLESFLNQCGRDSPEKLPFLIAILGTRLAALFIVPAYTGAILSFILIPTFKLPFQNVKEFVEDGTYRFGYSKGTGIDGFVEMSNDQYLKKAYQEFSEVLPGPHLDAMLYGINLTCDDHNFALLTFSVSLDRFHCQVLKIPSAVNNGHFIMELRYGSPYMKIFNRILKTMKSTGTFRRMFSLENNFIRASPSVKDPYLQRGRNDSIGVISLRPLFALIGGLYLISIILLLIETIINKIKVKRNLVHPFAF